ncbi:hypothetical protein [Sphingomonas sp. Sph1(2015)]|jgi:hypothetical protein|uniref:hypothetical protein n=1 Tax=Sphingomonas sp. Sph1(2015) TaxID=1628084 RepID=UPI0013017519|nr:hypothetical protein [Sphingomonas sp. Sph1(2015)]
MANTDQRTLLVVHEVSRTASRLAERMGCEYVLDGKWRQALDEKRGFAGPSEKPRIPA